MKSFFPLVFLVIILIPHVTETHGAFNSFAGLIAGFGAGMLLKEAVKSPSIKKALPKVFGSLLLIVISHDRNFAALNG